MHLRFVAHSETGPVRKNNQDSGYASPRLLVVADGMGGAAAGDLASTVAVDEFRRLDELADDARGTDMLELLAGAISRANDRIADLVADNTELEGMGTTVSAHMFDGETIALAHIGDSRAYILREGKLSRTTHDHSWVQSLIDEGKISEDEAGRHPHRNLLLKVINGQASNDPDLEYFPVQPGDRLLLCSDGLCGLVDDVSIAKAITDTSLSDALDQLIDLAHAGGGIDNITVLLADVCSDESDPAPVPDGPHSDDRSPEPHGSTSTEAATPEAATPEPAAAAAEHPDQSELPAGDLDQEDTLQRVPRPSPPERESTSDEPVLLGAATERAIPAVRDRTPDERAADRAASSEQMLVEDSQRATDEEAERYALISAPRLRWLRITIAVLLGITVVVLAAVAGRAWVGTQYYVGVDAERVAIYRGVPDTIVGIELSQVQETTTTRIADLPGYFQQRVGETIPASDLPAARNTADELRIAAEACIAQREAAAPLDPPQSPTSPPGPSSSPSASPSAPPEPSVPEAPTPPTNGSC